MFLVGLTGGIASGKSTVAEVWESLGAEIIDADELAREVVLPGSRGLSKIADSFGDVVVNLDGTLNRSKLAQLVFQSPSDRKRLEAITHPLIRELATEKLYSSKADILVYVIPLLVESKSDMPFDFVVTVEAPKPEQVKRMIEDRGMNEIEANARIASQASPAERANAADRILNSNQPLALLLRDAKSLFREIQTLATAKGVSDVG